MESLLYKSSILSLAVVCCCRLNAVFSHSQSLDQRQQKIHNLPILKSSSNPFLIVDLLANILLLQMTARLALHPDVVVTVAREFSFQPQVNGQADLQR